MSTTTFPVTGVEARQRRTAQRRRFCELGPVRALRVGVVIVNAPPIWARSWSVFSMLISIPGIGHHKAYQALSGAQIPVNRALGQLNERQRHDLCLWLEKRAAGWRRTDGPS